MSNSEHTAPEACSPQAVGVVELPIRTSLESFEATASRLGSRTFLQFHDISISFNQVREYSNSIAAGLKSAGVEPGDRVAFFLQNDPDFVIAQLGVWKAGAICVSINPMLRTQELHHILSDSGATVLVTLDELWNSVAHEAITSTNVKTVLLTDPSEWALDERDLPEAPDNGIDGVDLTRLRILERDSRDTQIDGPTPTLDDLALICYTSGTTGKPKGVAATHRNVAYSGEVYRTWMSIDEDDVFLVSAPIFHVTGLIAGMALAYLSGMKLVLFHRFDPAVCLEQIESHRTTFTVMATTAFQSLVHHPDAARRDLTSLIKVYSGGAPVTEAVDGQWRALTGRGIHNVYGLTETTGPTHAVPLNVPGPIHPKSGGMSIGVPLPGVDARLVDSETGKDVEIGEPGELWIKGPMVMKEYWGLPEATSEAMCDGYFRTGDVGMRDADGWFYIVDRLKDMINAAGYKVWPREVEEYLLQHPDIREAAVVGIPHEYRGETVKAVIVRQPGSTLTEDELIVFAKSRMAAYKYPRSVEFVDVLPKTASGKVLRRELRTGTGGTK